MYTNNTYNYSETSIVPVVVGNTTLTTVTASVLRPNEDGTMLLVYNVLTDKGANVSNQNASMPWALYAEYHDNLNSESPSDFMATNLGFTIQNQSN